MIKQIVFILLLPQLLVFGTLDRIQKAMEKKEYEKAYELIIKGYEKEPENPGVSYYHAQLLFDEDYAGYNLDSARIAIEIAQIKYNSAPLELQEEVTEEGISKERIDQLYEQIRDQAFRNTIQDLSITSANVFRQKFPDSPFDSDLVYKIDSMEYRIARLENTEKSLVEFIASHTQSVFTPKADSLLDGLRFRQLEDNGDLKDYYTFHKTYPQTRYKNTVEEFILKASTPAHTIEQYQSFIQFASSQFLKKKAADVLFYLTKKEEYQVHPDQDSIRKAHSLYETSLFPIMLNGQFGFLDQQGKSKIDANYQDISYDYKCELTADDWVFVKKDGEGQILTKAGNLVLRNIDNYRNISSDVGLVERSDQWFIYHKSGFSILEHPVEDAEVVDNKWIKVKRGNKWGLVSFMGLSVAETLYDDIYKLASFWIFERNELLAVYTEALILEEIEERGVSLEFKFDDIELVDKNALIGFRGERECLLDSTLKFLIPWGNYEIYPEKSGWYLKADQGYRLYNEAEEDLMDRYFPYLESNDGWLALKMETDWMLVPRKGELVPSFSYDSIKLINENAALLVKGDQSQLLFVSGVEISLEDERIQTFQRNGFISLSTDEGATIYDRAGKEVISGNFERTSFVNDTLIKVQIRGKQGLMHTDGDWVLNPLFDSIDEKDGLVLTLIDGKIGCYDPVINKIITTEYEARMERVQKYYLAKKEGKYGIVDQSKKEILSFGYDEIQLWNDTSYLVKRDGEYLIINSSEESLYDPFESIKLLVGNESHALFRFVKDGKYGLLSTRYGELLNPEFTDIFNIGTKNEPLIFADQHLDKAGFHVVSYINELGELITSKAYTRDEFDLILCDE